MGARPQLHRLLGGEYGNHVLVEQVVERHELVAVRARAADVDAAGEDAAGRAALLTEETVLAAGALVDREVASWPGGWDGDGGEGLLVAAAKRGLAARRAAVGLAAGHGEGPLADRADPRRGVVPRRACPRPGVVPRRVACGLVVASRLDRGGWLVHQAAA